ncbi:5698_t:CDS:2, partial [Cetraspora pellucida]
HLESNDLSSVIREFINLKNQNIVPTLETYHILLKSCAKTSDLQSAIQIINQMYIDSHQSSIPTKETYKYFLNVVEASSDHLLTISVLRSITNGQVPLANLGSKTPSLTDLRPINVEVDLELWKLILRIMTVPHKIYTTQKMDYFEDVKELCETFIESFRGPFDEETWRLIIRALGSYPKENDTFQKMLQRLQDEQLLTPALYSEIIWALSRKSNIQLAKTYLDRLVSRFNHIPSRESFYAMLSYYADLGRFKTVSNLINRYALWIKDPQSQMAAQKNLRDLWEFDFSTVLMQAYVHALSKYILSKKKSEDQTDSLLDDAMDSRIQKTIEQIDFFSSDDFKNSSFYSSWKELVNSLSKQSSTLDPSFPKFHRDHYDLIIRFNIFANQISPKEFPLDKSLEMLKNMRGEGMEPTFETYRIVLEGYAKSPEFQAVDEKSVGLRVEKALEIFDMIKLAGYDVDNIKVFQPLLESCLPQLNNRENIDKKPNSAGQQEKEESYNENISLLRSSLTPKIFEIEQLMKNFKVKHTQASTITLFQQLASVGDYQNMWKRWTKLSLMGYRRNEELYETILRLASKDKFESEYAINVVRHQMKRENPEVKPTFGIWKELMECCGNKLHEKADINIANNVGMLRSDANIRLNKEDINFKSQMLILGTCFRLPELHKDGEILMSQILETKKKSINFEFWKVVLNHSVQKSLINKSDDLNIHQTWEMFVDWRNEHFGFDKNLSRAFSVSSPIFIATTKPSNRHSPSPTSLKQASSLSEQSITVKLPHPPYRVKDIEVGYIYLRYLIHKKEFALFKEILNHLVLNFHSLSLPITLDHKLTNHSIDISLLDINVLEEFAYISWKQNNFDNLRWFQKNIIDRVSIDSYLNPSTSSVPNYNVDTAKLESFKTLSKWLKNCIKMSTGRDDLPSSSTQ